MKKYIPAQMIRKSRFITFFETWSENEKAQLITQMNRLIKENQEYADSNNYGHLCNLLTSIAMITHKCIYQQLFAKYGMPEMTARFCKVDDILYSDLPRAEFIYTQQIGNGGDMCDYSYKKR